jgi:hypothetical protein
VWDVVVADDSKGNDEDFDDLDEVGKRMKRKEKVHSMERVLLCLWPATNAGSKKA